MHGSFFKGIVLGSVCAMLVLVAGTALAGSGVGKIFNLGVTNTVDATTTLSGTASGTMLQVTNQGTGPALSLGVQSGKAPLAVNSSTRVVSLNADILDGKHASDLANADMVDGKHAADFVLDSEVSTLNVDKVDGKHAEDLIQGEGDVKAISHSQGFELMGQWASVDFVLPGGLGKIRWRHVGWTTQGLGLEVCFQNGAGHDMKVWTGWSDWPCVYFEPEGQPVKPIARVSDDDGVLLREFVLVGGSAVTTVHFAAQRLGHWDGKDYWLVAAQATVSHL